MECQYANHSLGLDCPFCKPDSWNWSKTFPVDELFPSCKPKVMAPTLEDRVRTLEEQVKALFKEKNV